MSEWVKENLISANLKGLSVKKSVANKRTPIRKFAARIFRGTSDGYGGSNGFNEDIKICSFEEANLVLSKTVRGQHAPIFDFDFPCKLVESATEGHYHLYIEAEISWSDYKDIMLAFQKAGLLEEGWVKMAMKRGYGALRKPELEIKKSFDVLGNDEEDMYHSASRLDKRNITSREAREIWENGY